MAASTVVRPEAEARERARVRAGRLLAPLLGPPLVALMVHQAEYLLVPWACDRGWRWPLHAAVLVALLGTLALGASAMGPARAPCSGEHLNGAEARAARRVRFMAQLGVLASALGALVVVAYWIAVMVLDPCHRA